MRESEALTLTLTDGQRYGILGKFEDASLGQNLSYELNVSNCLIETSLDYADAVAIYDTGDSTYTDTIILNVKTALSCSGSNVDYITKDQLLSSLTTRVADCEQKVKAIGQTTEVLLRTSAYSVTTKQIYNNGARTYTFGSMASDVQFVRFGQSSSKLLRGSSQMVSVQVYYSPDDNWTSFNCTLTFNQNGTFTIKDHTGLLGGSYYQSSDKYGFSGTLYQYKYAA